jgi:hypothetical protein
MACSVCHDHTTAWIFILKCILYLMKSNPIFRLRKMASHGTKMQNFRSKSHWDFLATTSRTCRGREIRWDGLLSQFSKMTFPCNSFSSEKKYLVKNHVFDILTVQSSEFSKMSPNKCLKSHFRDSRFQNFPGEHAPVPLSDSHAFGIRPPPQHKALATPL